MNKQSIVLSVLLLCFTCLSISGCKSEEKDAERPPSDKVYIIQINNNSVFQLEHIFVYTSDQFYKDTLSLISKPLGVNGSIQKSLRNGEYMVTVVRKKNKDSPLFAYTTEYPITMTKDRLLEYCDTYYRLGDLTSDSTSVTKNFEVYSLTQPD